MCPYCNHEFTTNISSDVNTEVECPECHNMIELDWNGDEEECTHNCSGCGHDCSAELAEELGIEPETPIIEKEEPDEENNNEEDM